PEQTGLSVNAISKLKRAPNQTYFQSTEEYERRLRIPLFLLFSCRK
ncbi:SAM-dependent methyltransferase, partial [Bacillus sp. D-CC]